MNDFTKEELEMLQHGIHLSILPDTQDRYAPLYNKIQSMIDGYCEHESDNYTYYKSGIRCTDFLAYACHDSPCFLKCKKCGEFYR